MARNSLTGIGVGGVGVGGVLNSSTASGSFLATNTSSTAPFNEIYEEDVEDILLQGNNNHNITIYHL
jgi:hypothetical protein